MTKRRSRPVRRSSTSAATGGYGGATSYLGRGTTLPRTSGTRRGRASGAVGRGRAVGGERFLSPFPPCKVAITGLPLRVPRLSTTTSWPHERPRTRARNPKLPPHLTVKDACYGLKAKFQPSAKRRTNQFGPRLPVMARGLWQLDVAADPTAQ